MSSFPQVPTPPAGQPGTRARVPWRGLDALAVFGLVLVLTVVALTGVSIAAQAGAVAETTASGLSLAISGIVMGAVTYAYVRIRFGAGARLLAGRRPWRASDALIGAGAGLAAWLAIVVVVGIIAQQVFGTEVPEVQPEFREFAADPELAPFFAFGAVVVAPIAEELFFRGMIFQALRDRIGLWTGMVITSVLFTMAHMDLAGEVTANVVIFVVIFPLGMLLAYLFQRRGSLLVPISLHAVFNGVQVALLLLFPGG